VSHSPPPEERPLPSCHDCLGSGFGGGWLAFPSKHQAPSGTCSEWALGLD